MKKSFIIHVDSLNVLDDLSPGQISELFLAIRDYHIGNELQLTGLMKAVFTPFRNQFERDEEKYQSIIERNKNNGKKGGRPKSEINPEEPKKPNGLFSNPEEPKKADNVNDSDNDNVNDNDIKKEKFNFKKSFLDLGVNETILNDWLLVRKQKKAANTETAFTRIIKQVNLSGLTVNECIQICAERSWQGFEAKWIENLNKTKSNFTPVSKVTEKDPDRLKFSNR